MRSAASTTDSTAHPDQDCVVTGGLLLRLPAARRRLHPVLARRLRPHAGRRGRRAWAPPTRSRASRRCSADPATVGQPGRRGRQFTPTSDVLPVDEFPQFESWPAAEYLTPSGPFIPVEGEWAMPSPPHVDDGYQRLASHVRRAGELEPGQAGDVRRADLVHRPSSATTTSSSRCDSFGTDDWTTLPDLNGGTIDRCPGRVRGRLLRRRAPAARELPRRCPTAGPCLPDR